MGAISTAIGIERRGAVSGYAIQKGFFSENSNFLPQQIIIIGEANTANQATIDLVARELVSAKEAGLIYGFGSPIHQVMRILRPFSGSGVAGIPTIVIPQLSAADATSTTVVWTVTGNVNKNATHFVNINGREVLDLQKYSFNLVIGDTPTIVATKIRDAVNNVLGSPVTATNIAGVLTFVTKWRGLTSREIKIIFNTDGENAGISYALTSTVLGSGGVSLLSALNQFEDNWYTTVINTYGVSALSDLEAVNGFPDEANPTGRFAGEIFKPFIAYFGSTSSVLANLVAITDNAPRVAQCTNVLCPAPNSDAFPWEAATNMVALVSRIMQDTPQLDVLDLFYPDMPIPSSKLIGDMSSYTSRDFLVKKGCSTVVLKNSRYQVKDLVTTYHDGDTQYSYPRNLNIDFNVKNGYSILENQRVKGHVIVNDKQVTDAVKAIKPKEWKSLLFSYFDELAENALIEDPQFTKESMLVQKSDTNPDRFETNLSYKRTGYARIQSTTVKAGF